jgi:hypothetical protein
METDDSNTVHIPSRILGAKSYFDGGKMDTQKITKIVPSGCTVRARLMVVGYIGSAPYLSPLLIAEERAIPLAILESAGLYSERQRNPSSPIN